MAATLRLVSVAEAASDPAPSPGLGDDASALTIEPPAGNRAAARGLGVPLGLMVGVPASVTMYGLIWMAASALGKI